MGFCGIRQKPGDLGTVALTDVSVPADSTGTHSLYTTYQDYEIMFHVSTLLPYTPNNRQQVSSPQLGHRWSGGLLPAHPPHDGSAGKVLCVGGRSWGPSAPQSSPWEFETNHVI